MKKLVAFYPYLIDEIKYVNNMRYFIETAYPVIDYRSLKKGVYDLYSVKVIYLNWIEDILEDEDKKLLKKAKFLHTKIIWVFHNRISHDAEDVLEKKNNVKFLIKISDYIIVHSRTSINYLFEYCTNVKRERVIYIPHPNFINDYHKYENIRDNLHISKDAFCFGLYGILRPYKNIEVMIDAFCKLSDSYECNLIIAGQAKTPDYAQHLQEICAINNKIKLCLHYINAVQMQSYLEALDVMVLPYSLQSSMNSGAMIMAFSYGKPVIVPDISMSDEYSNDLIYKYSYKTQEDHVNELAQKMEEAYMNGREENEIRGRRLLDIVKRQNDKNEVKNKLLYLLEK